MIWNSVSISLNAEITKQFNWTKERHLGQPIWNAEYTNLDLALFTNNDINLAIWICEGLNDLTALCIALLLFYMKFFIRKLSFFFTTELLLFVITVIILKPFGYLFEYLWVGARKLRNSRQDWLSLHFSLLCYRFYKVLKEQQPQI